jgi:hypothetical protein
MIVRCSCQCDKEVIGATNTIWEKRSDPTIGTSEAGLITNNRTGTAGAILVKKIGIPQADENDSIIGGETPNAGVPAKFAAPTPVESAALE